MPELEPSGCGPIPAIVVARPGPALELRPVLADLHSRTDRQVRHSTKPRAAVAISESEPWRQCGMRRRSTERPKTTPRYAAVAIFTCVATGAVLLTGSHDRLEAGEPGRWRSVKAASRLRRSRGVRALTGLQRSGSGSPSDHGSVVQRRGAPAADRSCQHAASACEVRECVILLELAGNRRLRTRNAPRRKVLTFLCSSALRPGRTSRLLSCHRSPPLGPWLACPPRPRRPSTFYDRSTERSRRLLHKGSAREEVMRHVISGAPARAHTSDDCNSGACG
jgi:hypothetical protein